MTFTPLGRYLATLCAGLLLAASASAQSQDALNTQLSAPQPVLTGDVDVTVHLTVHNPTRQPMRLLTWQLPGQKLPSPLFAITRDGQPVDYLGPLVKRTPPQDKDYVRLEPGATLSYDVELTGTYDLSRDGRYDIRYIGLDSHTAAKVSVDAAPLTLWLQGRSARYVRSPAPLPQATTGGSISFTGNCSAARQTTLTDAVAAATHYTNESLNHLGSTRSPTERYITWFGAFSVANRKTATQHYEAALEAFRNRPLTLDCSCTDSYYAYVYPSQPYKIYLCNAFWAAPMTGTDSKGGTLVHEMMHFTVVAGTNDWAYGQAAARALAISNPTRALNNSDNHEYLAENTPPLP
ncbi:M35 family metallo-endopeptidase [Roseateles sp. BYS180W]|uniref:M35 family metallo-endopeptidase n=1 Tax=Roseateles rivi TaxID=3299028 RepID=A0ABW7FQN2_9BURK